MMHNSLWLSRLSAYGLLVFSLILIWSLFAAPVISTAADKITLYEALSQQIARYEALQGQKSDIETLVEEFEGDDLVSWTFKGQAAAELQRTVRQAASRQGLQISNSRSVGIAEMGSFNRVGISLTVQGTHDQVYEFLMALRSSKPIMVVEGLTLRSQGSRAGAPVRLNLQMQVFGYQLRAPVLADDAPPQGELP